MDKLKEWAADGEKRAAVALALSGLAVLLSFLGWTQGVLPFDIAWVAILLCGVPIIRGAVAGLVTALDIRADVLVSIALVASVIIGETFAAAEIAFIMAVGALLEERTVRKARQGIEKLVRLQPRTARLVRDGAETVVPAAAVRLGDILRVLPGEAIAVDGVITAGQTAIDQSVMTGESLPVDKRPGDAVLSGAVNQFGAFEMRATKVGEDSSLQRMIRLVEAADANQAKIVRLTDRWATWIVAGALLAALGTWLFTGEIIRAVTILVVFCPCALVLATPTAVMAGIGNAARHGILVRSGEVLERLAQVKRIAFDKTGTLSHGKPSVVAVESAVPERTDEELLQLAAAAEQRSEHPLGRAIFHHAQQLEIGLPEPEEFTMLPGRGVRARIQGRTVLAGNPELLAGDGITLPPELRASAAQYLKRGCTVIFVAIDTAPAGLIALSDTLRDNARNIVDRLQAEHIRPVLLTGDNRQAASYLAQRIGISDVRSELLPEDKASFIASCQNAGDELVCMVGDGVNDALALKTAWVGVAMGGIGSDIAVEAADIALVNDDITRLPHLLRLARRTFHTIRTNIIVSLALNCGAIILAALGLLGPVAGALVHNAGSVAVILNSALLLKMKDSDAPPNVRAAA
jgi:heavy metal translocating P-type ATPase